jgi:O-antigen ligase
LAKSSGLQSESGESVEILGARDEAPWPLFLLFVGFVFFFYLQGAYRFPVFAPIRFELVLGILISIFAVPYYLNRVSRVATPIKPWAALLIFWFILMTVFSRDFTVSYNTLVERVLKLAMISLFIAAFVRTPRTLVLFIVVFLLAFLKMSQEGMLGVATGGLIWENQGVMRLHGATPMYQHPNSFAGTQLGVLPFLLALYPFANKLFRLAILGQAFATLFVIVYTGSRTAYVAVILWGAIVLLRGRSFFRAGIIACAIVAVAASVIPEEYIGRLQTVATQKDKEGASIDTRREIMSDATKIFLDYPLGIGVAAFPKVRDEKFGRQQDTHNLYLEVATNLGIFGLAVFGFFVFHIIRAMSKVAKACRDKLVALNAARGDTQVSEQQVTQIRIIERLSQAVVDFVLIRLFLGAFGHDLYEVYWWFSLGLALSILAMAHKLGINCDAARQVFRSHPQRKSGLALRG